MFELVAHVFQLLMTAFCLYVHVFVQKRRDLGLAVYPMYIIELFIKLFSNL